MEGRILSLSRILFPVMDVSLKKELGHYIALLSLVQTERKRKCEQACATGLSTESLSFDPSYKVSEKN